MFAKNSTQLFSFASFTQLSLNSFLFKSFLFASLLIACPFLSVGQTAANQGLSNLIETEFSSGQISTYSPFSVSNSAASKLTEAVVEDAVVLDKTGDFDQLLALRPRNIRLALPLSAEQSVLLELSSAVSPFSADFQSQATSTGLYYKGIVASSSISTQKALAKPSMAAISFFDTGDETAIGVFSFEGSTYVIGAHEGKFILYNDSDILLPGQANCATEEADLDFLNSIAPVPEGSSVCRQTQVQFECDYRMYTDKGSSVSNVENYVGGFFNVVQAVYLVDNFEIVISEIFVYTSTDPYAGNSSSGGYLSQFRAAKASTGINGNLAHLLSTRPLGLGGIAYLTGNLCGGTNRVCFSNISNGYNNFPFYSWTVDVTSHEMGHLLGSPHTHNCGWDGGAIDNCFGTEGSCPAGPAPPSTGGTIMSYCHITSVGKDFSLGFADQPAALMQNYIDLNTCFAPCSWSPPIGVCASYCNSTGSNSSNEWIESVNIGPLSNVSGNDGGFVDFGISGAEFTIGETYSVNLLPGFSGGTSNEYFRVWIDFNRNGEYSGGSELVFDQLSSGGGSVSGSFTIPVLAIDTGRIGLRVQMKKNSAGGECENFSLGEVEDYCVLLKENPCPIPVNQNVVINSPTSATISWNNGYVAGYRIKGRKVGGVWQEFITLPPYKTYSGFRAGKTYEWQVSAVCIDTTSPYSPIYTFTMPSARFGNTSDANNSLKAPSIKLHPNPAASLLSIDLTAFSLDKTELRIQLFDLQGALKFEQVVENTTEQLQLNVGDLAAGVYLLEVEQGGQFAREKLVVNH